MKQYLIKVYETRYFWSHLAKCDLKSRFRRSKLGLLWAVLQPFFLTIIMAFVFSTVFNQPLGEYMLYILSGMVVWDIVMASTVAGGSCLLCSEQYIRQFNHPITIYSLRYTVLNTITFMIEIIALIIWVLVYAPINLVFALMTLPLTVILLFFLAWALTTLAGYLNTKYRDYPQIMALLMQAIWYLSPVFFKEEMFMSRPFLKKMFQLNPLTHILDLIRKPFIYGEMPSITNYLFTIGTIAVLGLLAYRINKRNEKKIIFYL
ncbi:ABC transporter permease [Anaerocolumna xylanovorans]|uniref:Transport permease protein n=1 Tax=Anaerocolumna xylanovorans DSM 12503 TaxID=1121345 RepID=A0A1M7Y4A5_9FIRM|nr:ABC transporter permease [Anaerocolumna xylanovorans]SHO47116.1 lipopolysaccharide transport system permease protein [Anaerocolumna xylanovorans DSM 12503]